MIFSSYGPRGILNKVILESYPALALGVYVHPYSFVYITFHRKAIPLDAL